MSISQPDASPFLFVWYVFLGFLAAVLAVQLVMTVLTAALGWYNKKLLAKYSGGHQANEANEES